MIHQQLVGRHVQRCPARQHSVLLRTSHAAPLKLHQARRYWQHFKTINVPTAAAVDVATTVDQQASAVPAEKLDQPQFDWYKHWYPVLPVTYADEKRPNAVTLLNKRFVIWKDPTGTWRAHEDFCPHRLAPLSEGRIEADGTLSCAYHGWRFNGEGNCTRVPQSETPKAEATACSSSRSCLVSYPIQEKVGLLWIWPSPGAAAQREAAERQPVVTQGLEENYKEGNTVNWYMRDLPYGYDTLIENLTDPSHLPHSHHKLSPVLTREKGGSMPFRDLLKEQQQSGDQPTTTSSSSTVPATHPVLGMTQPLSAQTDPSGALQQVCAFNFPSALAEDGIIVFNPPTNVVYNYAQGADTSKRLQTELMACPTQPGKARVFTSAFSPGPKPQLVDALKSLHKPTLAFSILLRLFLLSQPLWKVHQFSNKLFDQDGVFLAMQDKILHSEQFAGQWQKAYYMPTSCDGAVIAARKWIESVGQGGPPYDAWKRLLNANQAAPAAAGASSSRNGAMEALPAAAAAPGVSGRLIRPDQPTFPSRREMMDRYSTHTQNCPFCKEALEKMEKQLSMAKVLGVVVLLGLSAYLGSVGGVQGLLGAQGWLKALGWGLVACLAWCGWTVKQCTDTLPTFHFVDFQHAKND